MAGLQFTNNPVRGGKSEFEKWVKGNLVFDKPGIQNVCMSVPMLEEQNKLNVIYKCSLGFKIYGNRSAALKATCEMAVEILDCVFFVFRVIKNLYRPPLIIFGMSYTETVW